MYEEVNFEPHVSRKDVFNASPPMEQTQRVAQSALYTAILQRTHGLISDLSLDLIDAGAYRDPSRR